MLRLAASHPASVCSLSLVRVRAPCVCACVRCVCVSLSRTRSASISSDRQRLVERARALSLRVWAADELKQGRAVSVMSCMDEDEVGRLVGGDVLNQRACDAGHVMRARAKKLRNQLSVQ